jgi:DNA-binding transcriptional regulator YbjK
MTRDITKLIEDLELNHEYCPKEVILQAAAELRRLHEVELSAQDRVERLYVIYQQACQHRDELMDQQRAQIAAMRGRMQ